MESDKINNGENPPASISLLQENGEFAFANRQYDAADNTQMFSDRSSARACSVSFPYMSLPVASIPWKNMHGAYQLHTHNDHETRGNMMVDLNQFHNLQNPVIDPNSISVSSNMTSLYVQNLHCPEGKMTGVSCTRDKIGTADNVMNDSTHFRSLQNHENNRNFPLIRGNAGGGYEMTGQGGQARISNIHGPQNKNFVGLEGNTNMLHNPLHSRELSIGNCDEVCADEFSYLKKIDGCFLSLGIGGNSNAKSDISSREITRGLDRAALPQLNTSHVQQAIGSSLNLGHNLIGEFSSFQNNAGGLTSLGHHVGGWTSSNNNVGVICGNRDARYEILNPYKGLGEPATSSGPLSNSYGGLLDSGQTGASDLVSESVNPSWTTAQPTSEQLQKRFAEAVKNFSQESSMVSSVIRFKGSSTRQEHSGQSFPAFKDSAAQAVDGSAQLPRKKPAGQLISTVKGCGLSQTSNVLGGPSFKGSEIRLPPAAPQVQRRKLTLQPPTLPSTTSPSHIAHVPRMKWQGRPQPFSTDLSGPSFATGLSQEGLPVHFSKDRLRPNSTTVTDQVISTAKECGFSQASNVLGGPSLKRSAIQTPPVFSSVQRRKITVTPPILPSMPSPSQATSPAPVTHINGQGHPQPFASDLRVPSFTTGQIISTAKDYRLCQASNVLSGPSLKRSAIQCPPAASQFQRSKFTFQQPILASMPSPIQTASGALIPAHVPHIKWEGLDGLPQPTGQKCMLCKRDLSFTPEGTVHQPTVPLAVAVLPCGHTFHDHCLQNITPEDQSKDPPCIPCAIGEI